MHHDTHRKQLRTDSVTHKLTSEWFRSASSGLLVSDSVFGDIVSADAGASTPAAGPPGPLRVPFPHRLVSWPVKSKVATSSGVYVGGIRIADDGLRWLSSSTTGPPISPSDIYQRGGNRSGYSGSVGSSSLYGTSFVRRMRSPI